MTTHAIAFRRIAAIALVIFAAAGWAAPASACGDIRYWIELYLDEKSHDAERLGSLTKISEICHGYEAVKTDRVLLAILDDAIGRGYKATLLQRVFGHYRCLSGAKLESAYARVAKSMDISACPTDAELEHWYFVNVRRANVRRRPAMSAPVIGGFDRGTVAIGRDEAGEWLKVESWRGVTGYVHRSLLTPLPFR